MPPGGIAATEYRSAPSGIEWDCPGQPDHRVAFREVDHGWVEVDRVRRRYPPQVDQHRRIAVHEAQRYHELHPGEPTVRPASQNERPLPVELSSGYDPPLVQAFRVTGCQIHHGGASGPFCLEIEGPPLGQTVELPDPQCQAGSRRYYHQSREAYGLNSGHRLSFAEDTGPGSGRCYVRGYSLQVGIT